MMIQSLVLILLDFSAACKEQDLKLNYISYLASDTFTAGGHDWSINLYPNGMKYQFKDYISLYIRLESEETDVNAEFELTLVDQS